MSVGIVGSLGLILISLVSLLKARSSDFRLTLFTFDFEVTPEGGGGDLGSSRPPRFSKILVVAMVKFVGPPLSEASPP